VGVGRGWVPALNISGRQGIETECQEIQTQVLHNSRETELRDATDATMRAVGVMTRNEKKERMMKQK